jgi:hypothetical protein
VLPPAVTACVVGVAVKLKFDTPSVTVALCTSAPLVPLMVSVEVPPGAAPVVNTVRVVVPAPPVIVAGLNAAVAPAGNPVTLGVTVPVNPFTAVVVIVYVVLLPAITACVVGLAVRVKVCVRTTPVPFRATACGLPAALSVMLSAPVRAPDAVGVNVSCIVQPEPTGRVARQLLVCAKSPTVAMLLSASGDPPQFVNPTV